MLSAHGTFIAQIRAIQLTAGLKGKTTLLHRASNKLSLVLKIVFKENSDAHIKHTDY